jgi:hypothetical protein
VNKIKRAYPGEKINPDLMRLFGDKEGSALCSNKINDFMGYNLVDFQSQVKSDDLNKIIDKYNKVLVGE